MGLRIRELEQVDQQVAPPTIINMWTNHIVANQAVAKRKRLGYVSVGK